MLAPHLPLEIIDIILQYDGRIKYRNGEFVNVIHQHDLNFYNKLLFSMLKNKISINSNVRYVTHVDEFEFDEPPFVLRKNNIEEKFYFDFNFDKLNHAGLAYSYYWFEDDFEISFFHYEKDIDIRTIYK